MFFGHQETIIFHRYEFMELDLNFDPGSQLVAHSTVYPTFPDDW